jgi:uncharacterized membrane protein YraQ (UPF0718 family)
MGAAMSTYPNMLKLPSRLASLFMAFCIASPIMDPEMFILTAAGISVEFAVVKTITAIAMGLLAGFSALGL